VPELLLQPTLAEIFTDLGLPLPHADPNQTIDFMSVKSYAYFFRVLYNASYLDREYSKKALELLGHTNFNHGLTAPLPNDLTVAHKFGERTITASTGSMTQELHDCGIIYFPRRPYLLCIMTKGTNPDVLANQIEKISKTVYDFMNTEWQTE
jgi:beta-lactamase class A